MLLLILGNLLLATAVCYLIWENHNNRKKYRHLLSEQHKQVKARFNESSHSFDTLFNQSGNAIALLNLKLDFFKTNQQLCRLLGFSAEKLLKWNLRMLFPDGIPSDKQRTINKLVTGKETTFQCNSRFIKKNGDVLPLCIQLSLICDSQNQPYYFILSVKKEKQQHKDNVAITSFNEMTE
jgi:PAS domain S-box-containing protein